MSSKDNRPSAALITAIVIIVGICGYVAVTQFTKTPAQPTVKSEAEDASGSQTVNDVDASGNKAIIFE